jgi:hypothetical protein
VKANKANRIVDNNSNYISSKDLNKLMKEKEQKRVAPASAMSTFHQMRGNGNLYPHHLPSNQPYSMWHAKSYESGIGKIYFCFHYFLVRRLAFQWKLMKLVFLHQIPRNRLIKSTAECRCRREVTFLRHECTLANGTEIERSNVA